MRLASSSSASVSVAVVTNSIEVVSADHPGDAVRMCLAARIGADAGFQAFRLADIEDVALPIDHAVDAGRIGKRRPELLDDLGAALDRVRDWPRGRTRHPSCSRGRRSRRLPHCPECPAERRWWCCDSWGRFKGSRVPRKVPPANWRSPSVRSKRQSSAKGSRIMRLSIVTSAVVAALVGFGSTIAIIIAAAQAVGADPAQTSSWVAALCLATAAIERDPQRSLSHSRRCRMVDARRRADRSLQRHLHSCGGRLVHSGRRADRADCFHQAVRAADRAHSHAHRRRHAGGHSDPLRPGGVRERSSRARPRPAPGRVFSLSFASTMPPSRYSPFCSWAWGSPSQAAWHSLSSPV